MNDCHVFAMNEVHILLKRVHSTQGKWWAKIEGTES